MHRPTPPPAIETVSLESAAGLQVKVLNLGATIHSIRVPTPDGPRETVLGYENVEGYRSDRFFIGATLGPFANRIAGARFTLDGRRYHLEANETETGHCLHGGDQGFHRQYWHLEPAHDRQSVICRHRSPHGAGGFPGNLEVTVCYQVLGEHRLVIDHQATTDRATVVSLANHAYFNLDPDQRSIDAHRLRILADHYAPVGPHRSPTGELREVSATPFDLRQSRVLADARRRLRADHNYALSRPQGQLRPAAELLNKTGDLRLLLHTTQPGLQLYTGDHLSAPFVPRQGVCLEAQAFPDAPNQPGFPSARLRPGALYHQTTIYDFEVLSSP